MYSMYFMDLVSKKVTSWTKCPNYLVDLVSNYNFSLANTTPDHYMVDTLSKLLLKQICTVERINNHKSKTQI